ncbi:MAG: hypothetical protein Kow0063_15680 [Anaerolineae bacterium]
MKRYPVLLVALTLVLATLACGVGGPVTRRNNEIRRAALGYELATRGQVDEVLVAFGLTEVRDNLGFEGGNTVWLNQFAEREYFRTRDPERTYVFLHGLDYQDGTATILVERGAPDGIETYRLTLQREGEGWVVVSDEPLAPSPPD